MNIKKTGVVTSSGICSTPPVQDMEMKVLSDNSVWARIFLHNCRGGTVLFSTLDEVLNTQTADKYSRLYLLDEFKATDNKFEFMLCYPDDTTQYNRWKQTNNPCDEYVEVTSTGEGTAAGYEAVHIDWTGSYWGGLTRQNSSATNISLCYISGSVGHGNWFYAIGCVSEWKNGIPSYNGSGTAGRCELWVRVDTCPTASQLRIFKNYIVSTDFIEI